MDDRISARAIEEVKQLANKVEVLEEENEAIHGEIVIYEQHLFEIKREVDSSIMRTKVLQEALDAAKAENILKKSIKDSVSKIVLNNQLLEKFVEAAEPNEVEINKKTEHFNSEIEKQLAKYEECPAYQAILQEEITLQELTRTILAKKSELMKLETEREFQ